MSSESCKPNMRTKGNVRNKQTQNSAGKGLKIGQTLRRVEPYHHPVWRFLATPVGKGNRIADCIATRMPPKR